MNGLDESKVFPFSLCYLYDHTLHDRNVSVTFRGSVTFHGS
jgi:hypothetical protein